MVSERRTGARRRRAGLLLGLALVVAALAATAPSPAPPAAAAAPVPVAVQWAQRHGIVTGAKVIGRQDASRAQVAVWLWNQAGRPEPTGARPIGVPAGAGWADAATWLADAGLVARAVPFRGTAPLLRRMLVNWLWWQAGSPDPAGAAPQSDVPAGAGYAPAVAWATEQRMVLQRNRFRPGDAVLRVDAISWLWRLAGSPDGTETNVVFVLVDDLNLAGLQFAPRTEALLGGAEGTTFTDTIASYPWCCPSRASIYSGQYSHNHHVLANRPPLGGYPQFDHSTALPTWFDAAGYETAFVGKSLNWYNGADSDPPIPPGWDRWWGWEGQLSGGTGYYFNYAAYVDGETVVHGDEDEDYATDVVAERSEQDLRAMWAGGRPFFLHVSHIGPHAGFNDRTQPNQFSASPAPRHVGTSTAELPQPPSFGEEDLSDKPEWLQELAARDHLVWTNATPEERVAAYRAHAEAMASIDESVESLVTTLDELGALEDTLLVFTSDNGYLWGEHRIFAEKKVPYDESLRIPLLIRGPGFPEGATVSAPTMNVDLAPTLAAAAGVSPSLAVDGVPLQSVAADDDAWAQRAVLFENWPQGSRETPGSPPIWDHYEGIRTARYSYMEHHDGSVSLFDHLVDPHELTSFHDDPRYAATRDALAAALHEMLGCEGASACTTTVDPPEPLP